MGLSRNVGAITELILQMHGKRYQLPKTQRMVCGVYHSPIDDADTPKSPAEQMLLHQGEPTEVFDWFKVDRAVGNVRIKVPT